MNRKRLHYIDIVKGIGIFLVILGHVYRSNVIQNWLYSFHMPLFFIVSGWLFDYKKISNISIYEIALKKIRTLIIPYFVFLTLNYLYWCVIERHFRSFDQGPLWFLPVMLIVELISIRIIPFVARHNLKYLFSIIATAFFVGCSLKLPSDNDCCLWLIRVVTGVYWYYWGWLLSSVMKDKIEVKVDYKSVIVITLILALLSVIFGCNNGRVDLFLARFNNLGLYIVSGIIGTALCFGISILLNKNIFLEFLGRNSLLIMCTHEPIKRVVIKVIGVITKIDTDIVRNRYISAIMIALLVVAIEIIFIFIWSYLNKITYKKRFNYIFEMAKEVR